MSQSRDLTTFEISCLNNIRANDHCRILPPSPSPPPPFIHQQKEKCNTVRPQRFLLHCLFCMPVVTSSVPILHRFLLLESHNLPEPRRVFLLHNLHEGCCTGRYTNRVALLFWEESLNVFNILLHTPPLSSLDYILLPLTTYCLLICSQHRKSR